jgi:hypothetical protein
VGSVFVELRRGTVLFTAAFTACRVSKIKVKSKVFPVRN